MTTPHNGESKMSAPGWTKWLLTRVAADDRVAEIVGDLEEAHRERLRCRGTRVRVAAEKVNVTPRSE